MDEGISHFELALGENKINLLANIPKYLILNLKGKKPPGKLFFTKTEPQLQFTTLVSYSVRKPDS
jgi:hypothetical protein